MGKTDEYQFDYLDDNVRFADQVNGALFCGKQVVRPDELEPADAQIVYLGKESGFRENFKTIADKTRIWRGSLIHVLAVENQTYVDYRMIFRNMLSESLNYHRQWKRKKRAHDTFDEYHTGLRQLFEALRYGKDKERMKEIMEENREAYRNIDSETRELLEVVAKVKIPEICKLEGVEGMENGQKTYDVCKAWADYRLEGVEEGLMKGKIEGKIEGMREQLVQKVCRKLQKNKAAELIAEELEEEISAIERIVAVQQSVGSYDVGQICSALAESE